MSVTWSPECARQAPIKPPTPPAPRIACRNVEGFGSGFLSGITPWIRANLVCLRGDGQAFRNFRIGQRMVAGFRALVNSLHQFLAHRNAAPLQPEEHIRLPAHGTNIDNLLQAEDIDRKR